MAGTGVGNLANSDGGWSGVSGDGGAGGDGVGDDGGGE